MRGESGCDRWKGEKSEREVEMQLGEVAWWWVGREALWRVWEGAPVQLGEGSEVRVGGRSEKGERSGLRGGGVDLKLVFSTFPLHGGLHGGGQSVLTDA